MNTFIKNISAWGDSIMRGVVLNNFRNRYEMLKSSAVTQCAELLGIDINNNARFGCTITKGSKLFSEALGKGLGCDAVVLEFGGNDCDHNWAEVSADPALAHVQKTPLVEFKKIYADMIRVIQENAIEPILVSLPPLDASRYFEWITRSGLNRENILRFIGDIDHIYRVQESYSLAVSELAAQFKCEFIDLRQAFLSHFDYSSLLCEDGIHPNARGHVVMSDAIVSYATARRAARGYFA